MFKVHEKYNDRETWINSDWIWSICQHDKSRDTVIESKHGDVLYVKDSVEEILEAIDGRECEPFSLHGYVSD